MQRSEPWFQWVSQALNVERERWFLWLPVGLGVGIGVYFALPSEPPLTYVLGGALTTAAGLWLVRRHACLSLFFWMMFLGLAGVALGGVRTWWVAAPVVQAETGAVQVEGQILRLETLDQGQRVTLGHVRISRLGPDRTPKTVRLKLNGVQPDVLPGDWVSARANLRPPPPPAMPGAFDFQRQSYFQGLGGVGFAFGPVRLIGQAPDQGVASLGFALQRLRTQLAETVRGHLTGDVGAVAAALMTGDRGAISEPVLEDMRASGLAHLLAISGLHVGLIAGLVFFAVRAGLALWPRVALVYPIKKWAAVAAAGAAFFYALMAGATVPTQRAFLMAALVLLAVVLDRNPISMRTVAWAALVILVISPESLLGASFQMSFAAVVALVAVYEALRDKGVLQRRAETWPGRIGRYVLGVALTSVVAGVATGVFAAYHFNRVADFGLVANILAVPLTALWIMPWAIVAYVLAPLGWEGLALQPMGWGIEGVLAVAQEVGGWPGAVSHVPAFSTAALVAISLGGLWLALWRRPQRYLGIVVVAVGIILGAGATPPDVIINAQGTLAAVRTDGAGYAYSSLSKARFAGEAWMRRAGWAMTPGRWPKSGEGDQSLRCDAVGCVYRKAGRSVAFSRQADALWEDCHNAAVVVNLSDLAAATCAGPRVVLSQGDLRRFGAHALWLGDGAGGVRVETVAGQRGKRPWVVAAPQSQN